jgi:hypothetical protein
MSGHTYKIKKSLLVPLGIDVLLFLLLLIISLFFKGSLTEQVVLFVIFVPLTLAFFEALSREVSMGDKGIVIRKFTRRKELSWGDITHVGIVIIRKKVYLLLTTLKGFYFISNTYESFYELVRHIIEHVGPEKVEEDVHTQMEHPIRSISDIVSSWFAAVVILVIIVMKFSQFNLIF